MRSDERHTIKYLAVKIGLSLQSAQVVTFTLDFEAMNPAVDDGHIDPDRS
jgi:hypothetical protein